MLRPSQLAVVNEVFLRGFMSCGLSLPLGFGKTLISLVLALLINEGPILVVVSKTLIVGWITEIKKHFGDAFPVEVLHDSFIGKKKFSTWRINPATRVVLTTSDVLASAYSNARLDSSFVHSVRVAHAFSANQNEYREPTVKPFLPEDTEGPQAVFGMRWGVILIDEIQKLTNIATIACRAICCVFAKRRFGLSGTMFEEPKEPRFLGFFTMLHLKGPRMLPDVHRFMRTFGGFAQYIVHRDDNPDFTQRPNLHEKIISHEMSADERKVFDTLRDVLKKLNAKVKEAKDARDDDTRKRYSAYLLGMISYVRMALVCPMIPLSSMYVDMADYEGGSEMAKIMMDAMEEAGLMGYLNNEDNILSSRFKAVLKSVEDHPQEKVIIFSGFRSTLTTLSPFIAKDRPVFTVAADMSITKRLEVLQTFQDSANGVLVMPFGIGAEGLNLQSASVVLIMDLYWNSSKIEQAIGRVYRPGQLATDVFVYFFVSNTGMEKHMLEKCKLKQDIIAALFKGSMPADAADTHLGIKEMIAIIQEDVNVEALTNLRAKRKTDDDEAGSAASSPSATTAPDNRKRGSRGPKQTPAAAAAEKRSTAHQDRMKKIRLWKQAEEEEEEDDLPPVLPAPVRTVAFAGPLNTALPVLTPEQVQAKQEELKQAEEMISALEEVQKIKKTLGPALQDMLDKSIAKASVLKKELLKNAESPRIAALKKTVDILSNIREMNLQHYRQRVSFQLLCNRFENLLSKANGTFVPGGSLSQEAIASKRAKIATLEETVDALYTLPVLPPSLQNLAQQYKLEVAFLREQVGDIKATPLEAMKESLAEVHELNKLPLYNRVHLPILVPFLEQEIARLETPVASPSSGAAGAASPPVPKTFAEEGMDEDEEDEEEDDEEEEEDEEDEIEEVMEVEDWRSKGGKGLGKRM